MRPLLVLLISSCCLCACSDDRVTRSLGGVEWSAASDPLGFGSAIIGESVQRSITLRNAARSARTVELSSTAPFAVMSRLELAAGELREVPLTFTPDAAGEARGSLSIRVDSGSGELGLVGSGVAPVSCASAGPCMRGRWTPATNACVQEPAPDGTACSSGCIDDGACQQGSCVGAERDCDDGNACTVDACDPNSGCLHPPVVCETSDPCVAASCDPSTGCALTQVADGTACGRRGCDVQDVCMSGVCTSLAPPEGASCGYESPCQALGHCIAGSCERPAPSTMTPAWALPDPNHEYRFTGLQDLDGNLYLVRKSPGREELVSLRPDGQLRFAVELLPPWEFAERSRERPLAIVGGVVITSRTRGEDEWVQLGARRLSDGALIWTADLDVIVAPQLRTELYTGDPVVQSWEIFETASGNPAALVHGVSRDGVQIWRHVDELWVELDGHAGTVLSSVVLPGPMGDRPIHDRTDALYARSGDYVAEWWVASVSTRNSAWNWFGPTGDEWVEPFAATDEVVIGGRRMPSSTCSAFATPELMDRGTGTSAGALAWRTPRFDRLVAARGSDAWFVGWPASQPCDGPYAPPSLVAVDGTTGAESWRLELGSLKESAQFRSLQLTNRSSLLLVREEPGFMLEAKTYLLELGTNGQPRFECPLDTLNSARAYLTRGFAVVDDETGLRGYPLPGYDLESDGWSRGAEGNAQHTRTAR